MPSPKTKKYAAVFLIVFGVVWLALNSDVIISHWPLVTWDITMRVAIGIFWIVYGTIALRIQLRNE